jgi:hypothetical protein
MTEGLHTRYVVRVRPINSGRGKLTVGVEFDCYQISHLPGELNDPWRSK